MQRKYEDKQRRNGSSDASARIVRLVDGRFVVVGMGEGRISQTIHKTLDGAIVQLRTYLEKQDADQALRDQG